jgi:Uma2 family endonuclease
MTTATRKLITAEEFFQMPDPPDGSRQELIRGVIVTMPPPGGLHGVCCWRVARQVGNFVDEHRLGWMTCNDTGFHGERDPDTVRGSDVSYWSRERLPEMPRGYITIPPDLAIEVVSPHDHFTRLARKLKFLLDSRVRLIWVVDPEDRSVSVYRPDKAMLILGENETLSGEEVLPGFTCRIADLLP